MLELVFAGVVGDVAGGDGADWLQRVGSSRRQERSVWRVPRASMARQESGKEGRRSSRVGRPGRGRGRFGMRGRSSERR